MKKVMRKLKDREGFTLVELSLSIAFIAILSITIALIINDAIKTYRRGLTLNQINTVGMDLVDDMRAVVQNSPAKAVVDSCSELYNGVGLTDQRNSCISDGARKFVVVEKMAKVDGVGEDVPVFGAFCTGKYSYIWNSGYFEAEKVLGWVNKVAVRYRNDRSGADGEYIPDFRLLKIQDKGRNVCKSGLVEDRYEVKSNIESFDIRNYDEVLEEPEILLDSDDANSLALYDLTAAAPAANGANAMFYSISFILGTVQGGINVMSSGNFCAAPNDYDSDFDYCAINKFNFAAQANGG